jgi:hypothetical protein
MLAPPDDYCQPCQFLRLSFAFREQETPLEWSQSTSDTRILMFSSTQAFEYFAYFP